MALWTICCHPTPAPCKVPCRCAGWLSYTPTAKAGSLVFHLSGSSFTYLTLIHLSNTYFPSPPDAVFIAQRQDIVSNKTTLLEDLIFWWHLNYFFPLLLPWTLCSPPTAAKDLWDDKAPKLVFAGKQRRCHLPLCVDTGLRSATGWKVLNHDRSQRLSVPDTVDPL